MRLTVGSLQDNSYASAWTRRQFLGSAALAAMATRLSAQQRPHLIVLNALSITEAHFARGLGDEVDSVSRFCAFPQAAQKLPKIGTYLAPNTAQNDESLQLVEPCLVWAVHQRKSFEEM